MPRSRLINPRLMSSLHQHFNSLATLLNPVIVQDTFNEETTIYVDDLQLANIKCYIEPASGVGGSGGETRKAGNTIVTNEYNIVLAGYYPQIDLEQHIRVDTIEYNILNASVEGTDTLTAIVAERVSL